MVHTHIIYIFLFYVLYVDVFVSIYSVQLGAFPSLKTELAGGLFNFYFFFFLPFSLLVEKLNVTNDEFGS